ncbi:MAG: hypothetical protein F4010_04030 [Cenarchaeum sp. SB0669_bin_11]|nr:hypothetical protein [Cenarchaeum sp. SB0669_bin_11]
MNYWKFQAREIADHRQDGEEKTRWIRADRVHEVSAGPTLTITDDNDNETEVPTTHVAVHYGPAAPVPGGDIGYLVNSTVYQLEGVTPEQVVAQLEALSANP